MSFWSFVLGMGVLHSRGVLHRDLKMPISYFMVGVASFECSMLDQGTRFWRAPKILVELPKNGSDQITGIWIEKVDVYGYTMIYYEVMTSHVPFCGYIKCDWKRIIDGERLHLPKYVNPKLKKLIEFNI